MEIELLPGLKVIIDESKFNLQSALQITPQTSDYTVSIDLNLMDMVEKTESKVQGALVARVK